MEATAVLGIVCCSMQLASIFSAFREKVVIVADYKTGQVKIADVRQGRRNVGSKKRFIEGPRGDAQT